MPQTRLTLWELPNVQQNLQINQDYSLFEPNLKNILTQKEHEFYYDNYEGYELRTKFFSTLNNKANNQPAAIGGPTVLYRPNVPRNESIFIPPSIETTITSGSWVCNYSFRQLERYNCKFKMHDLIRGQYITIAKSHNFFGFLPKTITIKIASEEEHKLSKPLEQSNLHTPKPNSKEIFLNATYLGNSIKKICSDFGLDITAIKYAPFVTDVPVVNPIGPTISCSSKTQRLSDEVGKGKLIITTALASDSHNRVRY